MVKRKILDSNRILQVETTANADPELLQHIKSTVLGTPGRLRYQLTQIEEKLSRIKVIHFLVLTRRNKILGSVGFLKRITYSAQMPHPSWYIRYFSIKAPLRARAQKRENFRDPQKGSILIRDIALPYMENPGRFEDEFQSHAKSIVYGYIESHNFRSMNFSEQMKGVTVRKYKTFIFSRLFLKDIEGVRRLTALEWPDFKERIRLFYKEYSLFTDENMGINSNYFVLERDGEIVAGAQVHPEFWHVLDMKGWHSRIMLRVLPFLPYIRNIFNPRAFRFLAIEGIWYKPDCGQYLNDLLEGICHHFKVHFTLTWVDSDSRLYRDLDDHLDSGLIGSSFGRAEVDVRITFNNYSEEEKQDFFRRPAYISAYDMV